MKKIIAVLTLVTLVFIGCSDNNNPIAPTDSSNQALESQTFIPLPAPENPDLSVERWFYAWGMIDGNSGGEIELEKSYRSRKGKVKVEAELEIDGGSFAGEKFIFYLVNDKKGTIDFFPGMTFDKDLTFSVKFEGVKLKNVDPDNVKFAYIDNDGNTVISDYDELNVDVEEGVLEVKGAKISHFSRYGFVK